MKQAVKPTEGGFVRLAGVALAALVLATPAHAVSKDIWISYAEIAAIDTTGAMSAPWDTLRAYARQVFCTGCSPPDTAQYDLKIQTSLGGSKTLAAAIYATKHNSSALRGRVRTAIMTAKASLDTSSEYSLHSEVRSALSRQLVQFVIAADIIDFSANYSADTSVFHPWLRNILTQTVGGNTAQGVNLTQNAEAQGQENGFRSASSIFAARRYLDLPDGVTRSWRFFKSLSSRAEYPTDAWFRVAFGDQDYYTRTYECVGTINGVWTRKFCSDNWQGVQPDTVFRPHVTWLAGGNAHKDWVVISPSSSKFDSAGWAGYVVAGQADTASTKTALRDSVHTTIPGLSKSCKPYLHVSDSVSSSIEINGAPVLDIQRQCESTCSDTSDAGPPECAPFDEWGWFRWGVGTEVGPDSVGVMYSWLSCMSISQLAEMLYRGGHSDSAYTVGSNQVRRVLDFLHRGGGSNTLPMDFPNSANQPYWMANFRYGSSYPQNALGRPNASFGFVNWTHNCNVDAANDIHQTSSSNTMVGFRWTGAGGGTEFEARYRTLAQGEITEANWSSSTLGAGGTSPALGAESGTATIGGLSSNSSYYVAIKERRATTCAWGPLSNVGVFCTAPDNQYEECASGFQGGGGEGTRSFAKPLTFSLGEPRPNPTHDGFGIDFSVARRAEVKVAVYDIAGREMAVLARGEHLPGAYSATWSGHDRRGNRARAGLYLIRYQAGGTKFVRRLVVQ